MLDSPLRSFLSITLSRQRSSAADARVERRGAVRAPHAARQEVPSIGVIARDGWRDGWRWLSLPRILDKREENYKGDAGRAGARRPSAPTAAPLAAALLQTVRGFERH